MSEAENPNHKAVNESLNTSNSPTSEPAICPFYSVIPQQNMAIPQLPPAAELASNREILTIDIEVNTDTDTSPSDWVAEPNNEKQTLVDTEFQKLLALNAELRTDNDDLYRKLEKLKQALADTEEAWQLQKKRSSVTESMFQQQTQELIAAQEQIKALFTELDTALQTAQRQESLAENYKAHLELSQQRLAQVERECAVVQGNYDEQAHRLLQSDNTCRELRTRLMRQQRQTLQFKTALEKCLDAPVPTTDSLEEIGGIYNNIDNNPKCSQVANTLFSQTQPIQPWSADGESGADDLHHTWEDLCLSSSDEVAADLEAEATATQSLNWQFEPTPSSSSTNAPEQDDYTEEDESNTTTEYDALTLAHPWDEKLDRAIQALLANQDLSASLEAIAPPQSNSLPDDSLPDEAEFQSDTQADRTIMPIVETVDNNTPIIPIVETITSLATEDYWSDVPQVSPLEVLETAESDNSWNEYGNEQGSPSPVVYPQRPPKGRKSLASVELPNFTSDKEK
jgi:hypothetical protein